MGGRQNGMLELIGVRLGDTGHDRLQDLYDAELASVAISIYKLICTIFFQVSAFYSIRQEWQIL
jgi:hypothetical protein